jgi:hypothetical protein
MGMMSTAVALPNTALYRRGIRMRYVEHSTGSLDGVREPGCHES